MSKAEFYLPDGTWQCTKDHVTEPCGMCNECRRISVLNSMRDMVDMLTGTGIHVDHTREQIGRCVYCSCGARVQGRLAGRRP